MRMRPSTLKTIRHGGNSVAEARSREIFFFFLASSRPERPVTI
jgi:hypothetical protein